MQQLLLHHAAPQHLQPVTLKTHLHFEGGMREGEVALHPADLQLCRTEKKKKTERQRIKAALGKQREE